MKKLLTLVAVHSIFAVSLSIASDLGQFVGYTIFAEKTIVGYADKDGISKQQFDGCDFGRKIIFEDNTFLTCSSYGYQYAYRPQAIILVRNGSWKMLVESETFDMQN